MVDKGKATSSAGEERGVGEEQNMVVVTVVVRWFLRLEDVCGRLVLQEEIYVCEK